VADLEPGVVLSPDTIEAMNRLAAKKAPTLVERVSCAIDARIDPDQWLHMDAARAAIREVARWMQERGGYPHGWLAQTLEKEAER
jgi:hypothetical protein